MTREQARAFKWNFNGGDVVVERLNVPVARDGGLGLYAIQILLDAGIPARRDSDGSIFMGHVAIMVPKRYAKRAERLVY